MQDRDIAEFKKKCDLAASPLIFFDFYDDMRKKAKEDKSVLDYSKATIDKKVADLTYNLFEKFWMDGEAILSMDYIVLPPFFLKKDKAIYSASPWKKTEKDKLKIATTFTFAYYSIKNKEFTWAMPSILKRMMSDNSDFYSISQIATSNLIKNTSKDDARKLAVWFRTLWYDSKMEWIYKEAGKPVKTPNLVFYEIENDKKETLMLCTLTDLGIKEPSYDILSGGLGLFHSAYSIFGKKQKVAGARHTVTKKVSKNIQLTGGKLSKTKVKNILVAKNLRKKS